MNPPACGWSLTLRSRDWRTLERHLFPGDDDEHGAVILAEQTTGPRGLRLLARRLLLACDGVDYVPGQHGYRALSPDFVRDCALQARAEGLSYLAVHNHGGFDTVAFSPIDLASHQRGYPALVQLTRGTVGGLVLAQGAAAGELWLSDGTRARLSEVVVPGNNLRRLRPTPAIAPAADARFDRQARLFGDAGQDVLRRMRVGVVGLGGAGSILVELLARLGVGHLVLIDDDRVTEDNLPRLLAAEPDDVGQPKTELAQRNALRANPAIDLDCQTLPVQSPTARAALERCDWIFLAADTHGARHWVNRVIEGHLIPGTQVGVKIPVDASGTVGMIHTVTRLLIPGEGCMWCNGLIDPTELAIDMAPHETRRQARYIDEVPAASVIALNAVAASEAVNHFMLAATGLHLDHNDTAHTLTVPRTRQRQLQTPRRDPGCRWCGEASPKC